MKGYVWWWLMALWLAACAAGLWFYSQSHISDFDPTLSLNQAAADAGFENRLSEVLREASVLPGSLVHIGPQRGCYCDTLAQRHHQAILNALPGYKSVALNVAQLPWVAQWLMRLPALVLLDDNGKVRYFGPYALGAGCFNGNTLKNQIVSTLRADIAPPGPLVISEATGCFCNAAQSG